MSQQGRALPEGITSAVAAADLGKAIKISAEVVVIGTGAGGAAAFCALAEAGVDVLAVEMGAWNWPEDLSGREESTWPQLLAEAGGRGTDDFGVVVFQGRAVGGSTVLSSNISKRPNDTLLDQWAADSGLDTLRGDDFRAALARTERDLGVRPIKARDVNANNRVLLDGMAQLGWRGGLMHRSTKGCKASGMCALACPNDAKLNAQSVYVRRALAAGGRLLVEARVDRVQHSGGKVRGVSGHAVDPNSRIDVAPFVIETTRHRVVLAASATASASIALRSSLPDPRRLIGTKLHLNPSAVVVGVFDGPDDPPIRGWMGIPQAVECTEFLDFEMGSKRRVWLVSGFVHPATAAMFMPGFGPQHAGIMRLYSRMAAVFVMVHDQTSGRVLRGRGGRINLKYKMGASDQLQLAIGMREAARVLLAGGASRVLAPLSSPLWIRDEVAISQITADALGPHSPMMASTHPSSTLWMGQDPDSSVVDHRGEHHQLGGLYVADGSLLPTSMGGPPQLLIYTLGGLVAKAVVESL